MSVRDELIVVQCNWARSRGYQPDARGYLGAVSQNLRAPLSRKAEAALRKGSGGELYDRPAKNGRAARLAKMKAVHSSAVLAVNVFDYWSERDLAALGASIGVEGLESLDFEAQHSTGLEGTPPNLDLGLTVRGGFIVGVESKFTEWLSPRSNRADPFKAKYFPKDTRLWCRRKLDNCQALAEALQQRDHAYRYLHAAQLLKHALGLSTSTPGGCSLLYLYYESAGRAADIHRSEIDDFARRLGPELAFRSLTYQAFFARLEVSAAGHDKYLEYLRTRYFAQAAA